MKKYLRHRAARLALALTSIVGASAVGAVLTASPAAAAGSGIAAGATVTLSNNAANANSGTQNTATYTWAFTTGSTAAGAPLTQLSFTIPSTAVLTASATSIYGLTGCSATGTSVGAAGSGATDTTLDVALACGSNDAPVNTPVEVTIATIINGDLTSVPGSTDAFTTSTVTTYTGSPTPTAWDSGSATVVNQPANNTTTVDVVVPESLTLTNNATSIALFPTPATSPTASVALNISTNAASGYTLSACTDPTPTYTPASGSPLTIPALATPAAAMPTGTTTAFAAKPSTTISSPTWGATWSTGNFTGYPSTCSSSSYIVKDSGPTAADTITLTNSASISSLQAAGDYKGTIDYLVTPAY